MRIGFIIPCICIFYSGGYLFCSASKSTKSLWIMAPCRICWWCDSHWCCIPYLERRHWKHGLTLRPRSFATFVRIGVDPYGSVNMCCYSMHDFTIFVWWLISDIMKQILGYVEIRVIRHWEFMSWPPTSFFGMELFNLSLLNGLPSFYFCHHWQYLHINFIPSQQVSITCVNSSHR